MLELRGEQLLIWLAALIDGEGSVMLGKRVYSKNEKAKRNDHFRAAVVICGTDVRLLETIVINTGVMRIYSHRVNDAPKSPRKRQQWTWRLGAYDIRLWLPAIKPYLVIKGEQADLLLEALEIKQRLDPSTKGFKVIWRSKLTERLSEIYEAMRALNTRGRIIMEPMC